MKLENLTETDPIEAVDCVNAIEDILDMGFHEKGVFPTPARTLKQASRVMTAQREEIEELRNYIERIEK